VSRNSRKELNNLTRTSLELLEEVGKAYAQYLEVAKTEQKEVKEAPRERVKVLKGSPVLLVFSYKGLPIYCKGKAEEVTEDIVGITLTEKCLALPVLGAGDVLYAKSKELPKALKLQLVRKDKNGVLVKVVGYEDAFDEKREHVRVEPQSPIPVYIPEKNAFGKIVDISAGGVGVYSDSQLANENESLTLEFTLGGQELKVKGKCKHVRREGGGYYHGFEFSELSPREESVIGRYVMERQLQILKELKALL